MWFARAPMGGMILSIAVASWGGAQTLHQRDAPAPPGATAAASAVSLTETHWNLAELDGEPVAASAAAPGEDRPYIYLQAQGDKLSGSGGCNRLFGSYDLSGSSLQFHSVASTMMACRGNSMQYESSLAEALRLTTGFQISGNALSLLADGRVLAKFQRQK